MTLRLRSALDRVPSSSSCRASLGAVACGSSGAPSPNDSPSGPNAGNGNGGNGPHSGDGGSSGDRPARRSEPGNWLDLGNTHAPPHAPPEPTNTGAPTRGGTLTFTNIGAPGYWGRRIEAEPGDPRCDVQSETIDFGWGSEFCCRTEARGDVGPADAVQRAAAHGARRTAAR